MFWQVSAIIRCLFKKLNFIAAYFAIQQMPLSVVKTIMSARPIITVILARIFLKENFGLKEVTLLT